MENNLFVYYIRGRIWEWTMAVATFLAGLELLVFQHVITFGAFRWVLGVASERWIGLLLLLVGWLRISALMFNGQLLFNHPIGVMIRGGCAVFSAVIWAQFSMALLILSIEMGTPSIGLPFWTTFILAEFAVAYSVGVEWKR